MSPERRSFNLDAEKQLHLRQASRFIKRLYKDLKDYKSVRTLLEEGQMSREEMIDPIREIAGIEWNYTFERATPSYLDLRVIKWPTRRNKTNIEREEIRLIWGENPLVENSRKILNQPSPKIYSNEPTAYRRVRQFIEGLEKIL